MEIVFSYPGIGLLLLNAVTSNDYPLMQAIFLVITFAVLIANLIVDIIIVFVDPRARAREATPMTVVLPISTEAAALPQEEARPGRWRRMPTKAKVGAVLLGLFVLAAIIGPLVTPYDPSYQNPLPSLSLHAPYSAHLLGTTQSGQDVLSQLLVGIRLTLELALIVGVVATALSVIVGRRGRLPRRRVGRAAVAGHERVPGHPGAAAAHRPARLPAAEGAGRDHPRAQCAWLAVGGQGDPSADAGHPQSRLRRRVPGDRRDNAGGSSPSRSSPTR